MGILGTLITATVIAVGALLGKSCYNDLTWKSRVQTFQIENLPECEQEKIQKFKSSFERWGNELEYDVPTADKIIAEELVAFAKDIAEQSSLVCKDSNLDAFSSYIKNSLNQFEAEKTIQYGKGVCRNFACVMSLEGQKLGMDIYKICNKTHAANLYKLQGKWYVADLALQVSRPNEVNYKMPLDEYIKFEMGIRNEKMRQNFKFLIDGKFTTLDEFLSKH